MSKKIYIFIILISLSVVITLYVYFSNKQDLILLDSEIHACLYGENQIFFWGDVNLKNTGKKRIFIPVGILMVGKKLFGDIITIPNVLNVEIYSSEGFSYNSAMFLITTSTNKLSIILHPGEERRFPVNLFIGEYDKEVGLFSFSYRLDIDGFEPITVSNSLELTAEVKQCSFSSPVKDWSIRNLE